MANHRFICTYYERVVYLNKALAHGIVAEISS